MRPREQSPAQPSPAPAGGTRARPQPPCPPCPWAKGRAASGLRAGQQADSLTGTVRQDPEAQREARPGGLAPALSEGSQARGHAFRPVYVKCPGQARRVVAGAGREQGGDGRRVPAGVKEPPGLRRWPHDRVDVLTPLDCSLENGFTFYEFPLNFKKRLRHFKKFLPLSKHLSLFFPPTAQTHLNRSHK